MFKSLNSIASVVGIFMYLTISKFKQVLRSRKGLYYNTGLKHCIHGAFSEGFKITHFYFLVADIITTELAQ